MIDYKLQEILKIDTGNIFLEYIVCRLQKDDYRGVHISQHNRYGLEFVIKMLGAIKDEVGSALFEIPRGDYSERENIKKYNVDDYPQFKTITNNVNSLVGKTTYNSIKKNFFVDFHRMGLITRYDKDKTPSDPYKRTTIHYVSLTNEANKLLNSSNIIKKHRIFTDVLDRNLFNSYLSNLVDLIFNSQYKADTINIHEFMFIFTDVELNNPIKLLKEYRNLKRFQKDKLLRLVQEYANPDNFNGNKTNKKDFHNWINETQQMFRLLKQTSYFQIDENNQNIALNIGNYGIFSIDNIKRSNKPKQEYFNIHNQEKRQDFELHHIVAISKARNKKEVELLDNVNNMIYLHKDKHLEITKQKNTHVYLSINKVKVNFCNFDSDKIQAINAKNALYSTNKEVIQKLKEHNRLAINTIYEFNQKISC
jgi:hypothetical protein